MAATDAAQARRAAGAILRERRFHDPAVPRPLHGVLTSIGNGLTSAARSVEQAIDSLTRHLPGGEVSGWVILALILIAIAIVVFHARARNDVQRPRRRVAAPAPVTAAELEAQADAAETDGDFETALRLRFRAGLLRLAEVQRIPTAERQPSAELARILASEDFTALARRFDEVVYGGQRADLGDVSDARRRWPQVLGGDRPGDPR